MSIELKLSSPFWEDETSLLADGAGDDAVLEICLAALLAAGYDVRVRAADGDLVAYEDYDWSDRET